MEGDWSSEYSSSSSSSGASITSSSGTESSAGRSSPASEGEPASLLPDLERRQLEASFTALATQVFVCGCAVDVYKSRGGGWEPAHRNLVPVVLLDTGETRARTTRGISIILAERGSCLALYTDKIDNLSAYRASDCWHTLCTSADHTTRVGLSFASRSAAQELWRHVEGLTADPNNICLSVPGGKRRTKQRVPVRLPPKANISLPCCFQHVTSVGQTDRSRYPSLQTLLPPPPTDKHP